MHVSNIENQICIIFNAEQVSEKKTPIIICMRKHIFHNI